MNPKDEELVNKPITNYTQMKTIFTMTNMLAPTAYSPAIVIQALNYLADHEDEYYLYADMKGTERRSWLRAYCHQQYAMAP